MRDLRGLVNLSFFFLSLRKLGKKVFFAKSSIQFRCQPSLPTLFFSLRIPTKLASLDLRNENPNLKVYKNIYFDLTSR